MASSPRGELTAEHAEFIAAMFDAAIADGILPHDGLYGDLKMPDPVNGACCIASAVKGAQYCTCWTPVYDLEQQPATPGERLARDAMCGACAYKPGSPERSGDPRFQGDYAFLLDLAVTGTTFWCHEGTRRVVKLVHPSGAEVDLDTAGLTGDYQPPIVDRVPHKADGTPADLCAGWAALRRRHMGKEATAS